MLSPHRLLALLGLAAVVGPAIAKALDLTEVNVHTDLWFAGATLFAALLTPAERGSRRMLLLMGALTVAVAAINGWSVGPRAFEDVESATETLLRRDARIHLACYGVVAFAGAGLVLLGLGKPRRST